MILLEWIHSLSAVTYQKTKDSKTLGVTCAPLTSYLTEMPVLYKAQFESQLTASVNCTFCIFFQNLKDE